jgi:hypothetical protein
MTPPPLLYRYREIDERLFQIIRRNELYFASPSSLNDPFECRFSTSLGAAETQREQFFRNILADATTRASVVAMHLVEGNAEALNALRSGVPEYLGFLKASPLYSSADLGHLLKASLETRIAEQIGVCCLSEVSDDPVMFAHYGADHRGCALQFSTTDALLRNAFPVKYVDTPPALDLFELDPDRFVQVTLGTKHSRWAYEREWRVVVSPMGASTHTFSPASLTGIVLGYKCSADDEAAVRTVLSERSSPIELSRLFLEPGGYTFHRRSIDRLA